MTVPETQAYLDEANGPTVQDSCRAVLKSFNPNLNDTADQLNRYARQLDEAGLSEQDEGLRQLLAEASSRLEAMRVSMREAQRHLRDLAARESAFKALNLTLNEKAAPLGYAVPMSKA